MATLDHLILAVDDLDSSVRFYADIVGLAPDGTDGPFTVLRVSPTTVLLLSPWGSGGHQHHLAFALEPDEFDAAFGRVKAAGIPYGDSYHDVGNMKEPGDEMGARGMAPSLYLFDPSQHLIELRHY